jgi:long-chain-fatty-acid--CoA ligase ACSBG
MFFLLQKVKTALGLNKCRNFFVGAAPMSVETFEYYMSLDIKLYEVYGMSECTGPHVVSGDEAQKLGSVGKTMPGCLTRLATNEDKDWY